MEKKKKVKAQKIYSPKAVSMIQMLLLYSILIQQILVVVAAFVVVVVVSRHNYSKMIKVLAKFEKIAVFLEGKHVSKRQKSDSESSKKIQPLEMRSPSASPVVVGNTIKLSKEDADIEALVFLLTSQIQGSKADVEVLDMLTEVMVYEVF